MRGRLPRFTLRARLAAAVTAAVAVVALGVALAAYAVVDRELNRQLELTVTRESTRLLQQIKDAGWAPSNAQCNYLAAPACAQLVDAAHPPSGGTGPGRLPVTAQTLRVARGQAPEYFSDAKVGGYPVRMLTRPAGGGRALQVAVRDDTVRRGIERIGAALVAVGAVGTALAALLGHLVSRTGLRPVGRLTRDVERISATRDPALRVAPDPRLPEKDELARLAEEFNTVLGELEKSLATQRRLVADASHELRTPLTSLRTNIDILTSGGDRMTEAQRSRATAALRGQLREVTLLVNDLIELARGEEPAALVEDVPLRRIAEHAVAAAAGHWPRVEFRWAAPPEGPVVAGVPARLARLVTNLLDNAAKFSPEGGAVEVALSARELTVRDHGPGIAAEDLPHVFDRFYRARAARSLPGSGLGLAMARQVARSHGMELTAEQAPGGGALFRLRFG